jgi:hypothetical protein
VTKCIEAVSDQVSEKMAPLQRYVPKIPCLQKKMEKLPQTSSPADASRGALAVLNRELLGQPLGKTSKEGRINIGSMDNARQHLP